MYLSLTQHPNRRNLLAFSLAAQGSTDDKDANRNPAVGSVVVTLEQRNKLVLGAFLRSGTDQAWQFWEGEFGPSELAAHVRARVLCAIFFTIQQH